MAYFNKRNLLFVCFIKFVSFYFIADMKGMGKEIVSLTSSSSPLTSSPSTSVSERVRGIHPTGDQIRSTLESRFGTKIYCENSTLLGAFDLGITFQTNSDFAINLELLKERITKLGYYLNFIGGHYHSSREIFSKEFIKIKNDFLSMAKELEGAKESKENINKKIDAIDKRIESLNSLIIKYAEDAGFIKHNFAEFLRKAERFEQLLSELTKEVAQLKGTTQQLDQRVSGLESSPLTVFTNNTNFFKRLGMIALIGYPTMVVSNKYLKKVPVLNKFAGSLESLFRNILLSHLLIKTVKLTNILRNNKPNWDRIAKKYIIPSLLVSTFVIFKLKK